MDPNAFFHAFFVLFSATSSHHIELSLLMYCDMSDKKYPWYYAIYEKKQKTWEHFSADLGHSVSPAI